MYHTPSEGDLRGMTNLQTYGGRATSSTDDAFEFAVIDGLAGEHPLKNDLIEAELRLRTRPSLLVDPVGRLQALKPVSVPVTIGGTPALIGMAGWGPLAFAAFQGPDLTP